MNRKAISVLCCVLCVTALILRSGLHAQQTEESKKSIKTRALEAGAAVLQSRDPIDAMNSYLDGFHFAKGNIKQQMEAHHYCTILSEDFTQCVLMDGNSRVAHLIGVEYVISRKLFETLSGKERKFWHSHAYEVKSGQLIAPGIPDAAEKELMKKLVSTYGKTWHTWADHTQTVPKGQPVLMMGFTRDGQISTEMLAERDKRMQISTSAKRLSREDIQAPPILPGADQQ